MASKFQEHCPDIERQEADVQKLNKRYNNLNQQTDTRLEGWEGVNNNLLGEILRKTSQNTGHIDLCTDLFCCVPQVSKLAESQDVVQQLPQWLWQPEQLVVSCPKLRAPWNWWHKTSGHQAEESEGESHTRIFPGVDKYSVSGVCIKTLETTSLFSSFQNLLSDIARKESDLNNVSKNAQLYQQAVKVRYPLILTTMSLHF